MTAPALVKEADMMRAIRAAKKLGAARVTISKDGTIIFDIERPANHMLPDRQPDDEGSGPIKISNPTKERVKF
jgi:hypothetical protein